MISLLKKTVLCKSFFLRPSFAFSLSEAGVNQKLKAFHKAVISSQLIKKVRDSPLNYYQSSKSYNSLRQIILDHIDNYQTIQSEVKVDAKQIQAAKIDMRKYFNQGVWLPDDMCGQKRFDTYAGQITPYLKICKMNEQVELNIEEIDQEALERLSFRKIKFCPTYVITGQIFRKILKMSGEQLLTGQFGVRKTYSFLLYNVLSENIFRYRHKHLKDIKYKDLPSEIDWEIPKSIYWSVNLSLIESPEKFFNRLIQRQCYELKNELKDKNILDLEETLRRLYYSKGMNLILFLDQINEIIGAYRAWLVAQENLKIFLATYRAKASDEDKKLQKLRKEQSSANQKLINSEIYSSFLKKIINKGHFQKVLYLSSVDIEKNLLQRFELTGGSKHKTLPDMSRLSYPIEITGNIAIADTCEFIVFLMRYIWSSQISKDDKILSSFENKVEEIKKHLYTILSGEKKFGILLPIKLNKKIKEQKFKTINQLASEQLKQRLRQLLIQTQKESITKIKEKVDSLMNKKSGDAYIDSIKPILMLGLWLQSRRIAQQLKQTQKTFQEFDKQKQEQILDALPYQQLNLEYIKIQKYQEQAFTAHLFGFHNSKLVSFVNPIILKRVLDQQKRNIYQLLVDSSQKILIYLRPGSQGNFVEAAFIDMFMPKQQGRTTFAFLNKKTKQLPRNDNTIFFMDQIDQRASGFMPIPKVGERNYNSYNFLKSFTDHIDIKLENNREVKNKWFLMLPLLEPQQKNFKQIVLKGGQLNQFKIWNSRSKLIDFVFFRYQFDQYSPQYILQIYAFDITTGKEEHFKKLDQFLQQFMTFKDKQKNFVNIKGVDVKVALHYFVITTLDPEVDYEKHFTKQKPKSQKEKMPELKPQNKSQILDPLEAFNFKNVNSICKLQAIKQKGQKIQFILKSIGILSMLDPKFIVKNPNKANIDLQLKLLKKLSQQALKQSQSSQLQNLIANE